MRAIDTFYVLGEDGQPVWVLAGDPVPTDAERLVRAQVTNRGIVDGWDDVPAEQAETPPPVDPFQADLQPVTGEVQAPGEEVEEIEEPPRSGPGSGTAVWASYAARLGLDVEGLDRADIIAAVDALPEA